DLVDGHDGDVIEPGLGEAAHEVALLDVLDHVPTHIQVRGHVADRHAPGQLQRVAFEGSGVAAPWVGEGDLDLPHDSTDEALHSRDQEDDHRRPTADGLGPEAALDPAARPHRAGATGRTVAHLQVLPDREVHFTAPVIRADVPVATDAEGVI